MSESEKYKNLGNLEFKKGNYLNAIEYYSKGIEIKENYMKMKCILFSNRSCAYYQIKDFQKSIEDACKSIEIDKSFLKGYKRKYISLIEMNDFHGAKKTIDEVLVLVTLVNPMKEYFLNEKIKFENSTSHGTYDFVSESVFKEFENEFKDEKWVKKCLKMEIISKYFPVLHDVNTQEKIFHKMGFEIGENEKIVVGICSLCARAFPNYKGLNIIPLVFEHEIEEMRKEELKEGSLKEKLDKWNFDFDDKNSFKCFLTSEDNGFVACNSCYTNYVMIQKINTLLKRFTKIQIGNSWVYRDFTF